MELNRKDPAGREGKGRERKGKERKGKERSVRKGKNSKTSSAQPSEGQRPKGQRVNLKAVLPDNRQEEFNKSKLAELKKLEKHIKDEKK